MLDYPMLNAWCQQQLSSWRNVNLDYRLAVAEYVHYNENSESIFLFKFSNEDLSLVPKPRDLYQANPLLLDRAVAYFHFFKSLLSILNVSHEFILALEVGDKALDSKTAPVFSFQKSIGESSLLLNDVNLVEGNFYKEHNFTDINNYADKASKAIFIGSTSGMHNSLQSVEKRENPRIDAGIFFRASPDVDFRLPNIVQCDADAAALIRSLGFGSENYMSWQEQFAYKFLISMDGNGATCQRLAVALKSNSVVLKYESTSQIYYLSGLIPWYHYVPISSHQDVLNTINLERSDPHAFEQIAQNGREFFNKYLTEDAVMRYASMLISEYARLFKKE